MVLPQNSTKTFIHGWGGTRLALGDVSVGLTPDIGGRIMSLTFQGDELFYVHPFEKGNPFDLASIQDIIAFKNKFGFRLFGGDKTWIAPEHEWQCKSPPVDLDAGRYAYEQHGGVCIMTSPVCRETGIRIVRRVRFENSGTLRLEEEFENTTARPLLKGIWNVTQVRRPFDVYIAASPEVIRSYHHADPTLPEPGQSVEKEGGWVKITCRSSVCFKFGGIPRVGRVFLTKSFRRGLVAFAREFSIDTRGSYAHQSAVEVFNSAQYPYAEVELHAPLRTIPPGGRVSFSQQWRLMRFPPGVGVEEMADKLFPFN